MTLDKAIEICEEKSKRKIIDLKFSDIPMTESQYQEHIKNCDIYLQFAKWLKELKAYRELVGSPKKLEKILNNLMVCKKQIISNINRHPNCHMRTALGNCDPIGGFCTSVNEFICEALHKVSRSKGEWIYGEHEVAMCDGYRCDRCEFFVPWDYKHKSIDFIKDYKFCPSCGAKMKGTNK